MQLMSFVLIERGGRYLLVQEASPRFRGKWYLPGGKADEGESPDQAAKRETMEEAGCEVTLNGIFYLKYLDKAAGKEKLRIYYEGSTADTKVKTTADEHSLGSGWFSYDELSRLSLRQDALEVIDIWMKHKNSLLPLSNFSVAKEMLPK